MPGSSFYNATSHLVRPYYIRNIWNFCRTELPNGRRHKKQEEEIYDLQHGTCVATRWPRYLSNGWTVWDCSAYCLLVPTTRKHIACLSQSPFSFSLCVSIKHGRNKRRQYVLSMHTILTASSVPGITERLCRNSNHLEWTRCCCCVLVFPSWRYRPCVNSQIPPLDDSTKYAHHVDSMKCRQNRVSSE
jgi:hypothetical protein